MQSPARANVTRSLLTLLLCLLPVACSSTGAASGSKKAERTVGTAEKMSGQVVQLGAQLQNVGAALEAVRQSVGTKGIFSSEAVAKGDIEAAFKNYRKGLATLRDEGKKVARSNASLKDDLAAYLDTWKENMAQVQNVKLREASMQRRDDSQKLFQKVSEEFSSLWQAYEAHLGGLNEFEVALGSDLTPAGIEAIDGPLSDAVSKGKSVQKGLARGADILREFAAALRTTAPPADAK